MFSSALECLISVNLNDGRFTHNHIKCIWSWSNDYRREWEKIFGKDQKGVFWWKISIEISFVLRQNVENKLQSYLTRAKDTLVQRQIVIPKPAKRPMRKIQESSEDEEDEIEQEPAKVAVPERTSSHLRVSSEKILRPVRTAKVKANKNLVSS